MTRDAIVPTNQGMLLAAIRLGLIDAIDLACWFLEHDGDTEAPSPAAILSPAILGPLAADDYDDDDVDDDGDDDDDDDDDKEAPPLAAILGLVQTSSTGTTTTYLVLLFSARFAR